MTTFDLSPLFRSTVGFDRMARMFEMAGRGDDGVGYPPYNIEKTAENAYRITMAVAGFGADDLAIEVEDAVLTVTGRIAETGGEDRRFLHRGIASRAFRRTFQLADYVRVSGANLADGLLHIDLAREVPEQLKPRRIPIGGTQPTAIEAKAA